MKTKQEVMEMDRVEFAKWMEKYKPLMPPYKEMVWKSGISRGTFINVIHGFSENKKAREIIYDAIQQSLVSVTSS